MKKRIKWSDDDLIFFESSELEIDPKDSEEYQLELEEIKEWELRSILKYFSDEELKKPEDLDFLCEDLKDCKSFQNFAMQCKCVRENVEDSDDLREIAEQYLAEVKNSLLETVRDIGVKKNGRKSDRRKTINND
jgi:hypothetical protein